ncbi:hypothetical protein BK007_02410 [Methanobacterium subterraneum]|uniref:Uncharacterized protein n=1 Tax=Methanobacterium subterraneum TaxID=59277 RepID=A0A2H4VA62_9EURY|nr:hypothetical protein [Methanobacterium subterraneum]AUB54982.1 hypothetical protein BK007_02410 [Methanobacterium subterraneum]
MFKIAHKITADNLLRSEELESWLDDRFFLNYKASDGSIHFEFTYKDRSELDEYGRMVVEGCPDSLGLSLYWIRNSTEGYSRGNHIGRLCYYHIWPLFFRKFPLGQIWIIESPKSWADKIWTDQRELGKKYGYDKMDPIRVPQEMSGLQADYFTKNTLNVLSYGIYPLISCASIQTGLKSSLTIFYIPDRAFKHSQMTEENTLYTRILWDFHHVYDDQWTFDGSRGPKSAINEVILNPVKQLDYFQWLIEKIDDRMKDIISIEDALLREKLVMTVNRAITDALISVTSELPYMSMVFFFSFLDKLANVMYLLKIETSEVNAWKMIVNTDFLSSKVIKTLKKVPNKAGEHFINIISSVTEELEYNELSPETLRNIRNTHHGYNLTRLGSIERLMTEDGELNNDIPLIVTPLLIYLFTLSWKVS